MGGKSSKIKYFKTTSSNRIETYPFGFRDYRFDTLTNDIETYHNTYLTLPSEIEAYFKEMLQYSSKNEDVSRERYTREITLDHHKKSYANGLHVHSNITNDDYHVSKGFALLIFNDTFVDNRNFPFTSNDKFVLVDALRSLNFTIEAARNLTASEIIHLINYYATKFDFSGYDCFFCVVSSHGDKSIVYGTDMKALDINEKFVEPLFNCQTLQGKPKILVFDACRGHQTAFGNSSIAPFSGIFPRLKNMKDVFVAYATLDGYVAGGTRNGSFFLQSLGYILKHFGHTDDLNSLFTRVNADVEATGDTQIPEFYTRLKRKVYLC